MFIQKRALALSGILAIAATRYNDNVYESPSWIIQGKLFMRAAHFVWYPTNRDMQNEDGQLINAISWFPILPEGVTLGHRTQPGGGPNGADQQIYEVTVKDVPPSPEADYMPPIGSFTYRVLFNFTPYRSTDEYWKNEGKHWSKSANNFIGPDGSLRAATQKVIEGATTDDEKLHKIYAAVMALENSDYTRERSQKEDKAAGVAKVSTAGDVYKRGRGNSAEIVYVFIGMARAAGMKAYAMLVPNRESHIFAPMWMSTRQLENTVAIVNVGGERGVLRARRTVYAVRSTGVGKHVFTGDAADRQWHGFCADASDVVQGHADGPGCEPDHDRGRQGYGHDRYDVPRRHSATVAAAGVAWR